MLFQLSYYREHEVIQTHGTSSAGYRNNHTTKKLCIMHHEKKSKEHFPRLIDQPLGVASLFELLETLPSTISETSLQLLVASHIVLCRVSSFF